MIMTFLAGVLFGMIAMVFIAIARNSVPSVKEAPRESEQSAEERFNAICEEIEDMSYIDSIVDFCKGK